ncbi:MAG: 3-hydroxyacyl-ACP dehydratase FabZ [Elusimicrobia bacterium]|nr:3-hydroxyacyl-ACP dehydratase FabZ [Elusimicrobiota bacterium]
MDKDGIKKILPHREPYLMIDNVNIRQKGKEGTGIKELSGSEYFFEGHFPGKPVMPGVLIVETITQTAMVVLGKGNLVLKKVQRVKFRQTIEPGDKMEIKVRVLGSGAGSFTVSGEVYVGGVLAASGEIVLSEP